MYSKVPCCTETALDSVSTGGTAWEQQEIRVCTSMVQMSFTSAKVHCRVFWTGATSTQHSHTCHCMHTVHIRYQLFSSIVPVVPMRDFAPDPSVAQRYTINDFRGFALPLAASALSNCTSRLCNCIATHPARYMVSNKLTLAKHDIRRYTMRAIHS